MCLALFLALGATAFARAPASPVDRFIDALDRDATMPGDARRLIRESWERCSGCDGDAFLTQGLSLMSPRFLEALDAYDAEDYDRCAALMAALTGHANKFLAANAAVWEIKSLVAAERTTDAAGRIDRVLADGGVAVATYTYFAAEVEFLKGFCLLSDLEYDDAAAALTAFLDRHPDASQRLVMAARQMLAELANRAPGQIDEVADLMRYAGRRLHGGDAGQRVQTRQQRIIDLLNHLIDDAEQQEQNSQNSQNSSRGGSHPAPAPSPQRPMPRSQLPPGAGDAARPHRSARHANPAETWGAMPPAQRRQILQALKESFPSRYRQLVEQYYEQLAKQP